MQVQTPTLNLFKTEKPALKQEAISQSLLAWIPYSITSNEDIRLSIDQLIDQHKRVRDRPQPELEYLNKIGEAWKSRLKHYYPTSPTHTLIFTSKNDHVTVIPSRYKSTGSNLDDQNKGWRKLLKSLLHETRLKVIQLTEGLAELYDIKQGCSSLLIQQMIYQGNRDYYIKEFAYAVRQICSDGESPLIARCLENSFSDRDLARLNAIIPVQICQLNHPKKFLHDWLIEVESNGLIDQWTAEWHLNQIDQAMKRNKWTTNRQEIITYMMQNKIETIVMSESNEELFKNNHECNSLVFKNKIRIIKNEQHRLGAILK